MHEKIKIKIMLIYAHVMDLNYKIKKKFPKFQPSGIGTSRTVC